MNTKGKMLVFFDAGGSLKMPHTKPYGPPGGINVTIARARCRLEVRVHQEPALVKPVHVHLGLGE